ncbi:MAG: C40 family peptidase [Christensenellales bacterium]
MKETKQEAAEDVSAPTAKDGLIEVSFPSEEVGALVREASANTETASNVSNKKPRRPGKSFFGKLKLPSIPDAAKRLLSSPLKWFSKLPGKTIRICSYAAIFAVVVLIAVLLVTSPSKPSNQKIAAAGDFNESAPASQPVSSGDPSALAPQQNPLSPEPLPTLTPVPSPAPLVFGAVLQKGDTSELVITIQSRLMDLGYMDKDEPTSLYGPITQTSVELFQRVNELEINGCVDEAAYNLLLSDSAKKYSVSIGVEGTDVEELQKRLVELGYLSSSTGYFGTETETAVKRFQERNNLTADGTVGEKTREMLYSEDAAANVLTSGEASGLIQSYQERLKKLGYLTTTPDGKFGPDTTVAVKRFQERNGLIADGHIGPQTAGLLMSSEAQGNAVQFGMRGSDVEKIQARLKELKYLGSVTGYFGSGTQSAVEAFQKRNGLSVDGKIGPATMAVLLSPGAKAAAKTSNPTKTQTPSQPAKTPPPPTTGGSSDPAVITGANADSFVSVALSKLGARYVRGGKGPNSFDCSGLVYWCLNQAGVKQSYMTSTAWRSNTKYQKIEKLSDVQKGDVLCFHGHVGIALGDGRMVDASSTQGKVRITSLSQSYWQKEFICAYRIF